MSTIAAATSLVAAVSVGGAASAAAIDRIDMDNTYDAVIYPGERVLLVHAPNGKVLVEGPRAVKVKVKSNGRVLVTGKKTKRTCYADEPTIVRWVDPITGKGGAGAWIEFRVCNGEPGIPTS